MMQKIAAEMNISETAYIQCVDHDSTFENSSRFGLRWFTPTNEVPLCGHATLASAAVIFFSVCKCSCVCTTVFSQVPLTI